MHTSSTLTLMSAQSMAGYIHRVVSYRVLAAFKKLACLLHVGTTIAILHLSMLYLFNGEIE
jgi:hypothetical protein